VITLGLFLLSVLSGMLGLGVAFAAVPFLSLFLPDLVHQVQPLSLLLNGITGFAATLGFARSGLVNWKKGGALAIVATVFAPLGSLIATHTAQRYVWYLYFLAVVYLAYRMFRPVKERPGNENFKLALLLIIPIAVLSGFLGVGPGFLLLPTLMLLGFEAKRAAGMNALAITPPSFSALIPHLSFAHVGLLSSGAAVVGMSTQSNTSASFSAVALQMHAAHLDWKLTLVLVLAGSVGSFAGARLTSLYLPGPRIKQVFGVLLVVMTVYKIWTLTQ
jgi:uncharacterized membrane protein YfcA